MLWKNVLPSSLYSETSIICYHTTLRHSPQDSNGHSHHYDHFKLHEVSVRAERGYENALTADRTVRFVWSIPTAVSPGADDGIGSAAPISTPEWAISGPPPLGARLAGVSGLIAAVCTSHHSVAEFILRQTAPVRTSERAFWTAWKGLTTTGDITCFELLRNTSQYMCHIFSITQLCSNVVISSVWFSQKNRYYFLNRINGFFFVTEKPFVLREVGYKFLNKTRLKLVGRDSD
jgi:hypothetical protein